MLTSRLLWALCVLTLANTASAQNTHTPNQRQAHGPRFDFQRVLQRKGLDPRKLTFKVPRRCDLTASRVGVFYDRRLAGYVDISEETLHDAHVAYPEWISMQPGFRGKGLGSLLYLATAKWVHSQTGCLMQKSFDTTDHADSAWRRFVDRGFAGPSVNWARRRSSGVRMKASAMDSPDLQQLWRFVQSKPVPTGAEWARYPQR